MWELLTGPMMIRLVAYSTMSYMLSTLGITWDDSRFWCFIVLIVILEHLAHSQGKQDATTFLLSLHRGKLIKLKDFFDRVENGTSNSADELIQILKEKDGKDE